MRYFYTRRTIFIALGISLAIISFFVWYSYRNMQQASADSLIAAQTLQSLRALEDVMDDMQDIETGQRGYVISGNKEFLEPYHSGLLKLAKDTNAIRALFPIYPQREKNLRQLLQLVDTKIEFVKESVRSVNEYGRDSAYKRIQSGEGLEIMDRIRKLIFTFENEDRQVLRYSNEHREVVAGETAKLFGILAIVFFCSLTLFFVRIAYDLKRRESNEKRISYLADMVEQAGEAIISADVNFDIQSWNRGATEMYGYSSEEAIGKKYHLLLQSKKTDEGRISIVEQLLKSGYYTEEFEYVKKNGQSIYVQASYTVLRDKDNNVNGCTIVHRNVTEKKLAEQLLTEFNQKLNSQVQAKTAELKEAFERFNIIASATNDVVWDADLRNGGSVWWNNNFYTKFGFSEKDNLTTTDFWDEHIHPEDKKRVQDHIDYILTRTNLTTWGDEYRFKKADGTYLHIYDRSSVIRDENGVAVRMIGSMADVSDLFMAREELNQSEEKYRTLVDQATDGIFVADLNGKFILTNPAAYKISQYSKEELEQLTIFDLVDKEDLAQQPFRFDELKEGKSVITERVIRNKYGEAVLVDINARFLSDGRLLVFVRDITEKKKTEEEVVRSNARFQIIAKATSDFVWDWNLEESVLWWNDSYYNKMGYSKKKELVAIDNWFDNIHPDDIERVKEKVYKIFAGTELIWRDEYRYAKADGTYLNFLDRGHIIRNKEGKAIRMIGSMVDVTDIYIAEEELRQSEERYRSLIEQATDAILIYSVDGVVYSFNRSAAKMTGYTVEEFSSLRLQDFLIGNIVENPEKFEELLAGDSITINRQLKKKDGTLIDVEVNARLLGEGKIMAFGRDITDRKKAEEKLINNELRFRTLTENAPVGIFQTNEKGETIYVNGTWLGFTGLTFEEAMGDGWLDAVHPADKLDLQKGWNRKSSEGTESMSEYRFIDKKGNTRWVSGNAVPLKNSYGVITGYIGTIDDITERKLATEALQASEKNMHYVLSGAAESFYVIDKDCRITLINKVASYNLEKAWGQPITVGTNILEFIPDENEEPIRKSLQQAFAGEKVEYELRIHLENFPPWVLVNYIPVKDEAEEVIGVYISTKDISARKAAEEKIKDSENLNRTLVENAPEALVVLDMNTQKFMSVSDSATKLFKMSKAELLDKGPAAISPEYQPGGRLSVELAAEKISQAMKGEKISFEWIHSDSEGRLIPCEVWLALLPSEGRMLIRGSVIDITERKRSEELIRTAEETRRLIMNSALDAIVSIDVNSMIIFWSPQAENIFGWKEVEILGKTLEETIIPPAYRERHRNGMQHYFNTGKGPLLGNLIELTALDKDGREFPVELRITPVQQGSSQFFCAFIRDITDRKKAAETIKLNEEKYTTLVEQAIDAIALYNAAGEILDINTGALELLGYSKEELLKMSLAEILTSEEISASPVRYDILQQGSSTIKQRMMRRKDGSKVLTEVRSQQLPDGRFLSVIRDLTDRIEAQKKIQTERDLSDRLIDSLPGIFYLFDDTGRFIRWNKELEIVSRYTTSEIAALHPTQFFDGEGQLHIIERIQKVFMDGEADAEADFISKDGTRTPYYFKAIRVEIDGKMSLIGTGIDVSELKKAQNELKASEEKYKLLFKDSPLPMWVYETTNFRILDVNEAAILHYGYSKDEFMQLSLLDLRPQEEVNRFIEQSQKNQTGIRKTGVWKHKLKNGTIIDVEINSHDIQYNDLTGRLVVAVDITNKLKNEEEIKRTSDQLRELADHLNNIREEERTHIAREIHDELGQHLTVLKMDVSWLNKRIGPDASEQVKQKMKDLLEMLDGTVKTVRRIASDLRPSLLDDLGLAAAMEWQLEEFEKRSDIKTLFINEGPVEELSQDIKTGLFRILQESLTNVARHSGAKDVVVNLLNSKDGITLEITDNGNGFDKFATSGPKKLGILGMNERAVMMGGECETISSPGKGTTISVKIPFTSQKA